MTRGQCRRHVILWLVLGPIALIGLALAVVHRPAEPFEDGPLPGVDAGDDVAPADEGAGG